MADTSSVQVAVRIRPLVESEISKGCQDVLEVYPEIEQIRIKNTEKAFTFNYALSPNSSQDELYIKCVQGLLKNLFDGYNVTILAYGQTGSGKTYSMGTAYSGQGEMGVIPRAVYDIFDNIQDQFSYEFFVTVSFMELYQEVLYDLLSDKPREQCSLEIREDVSKGIVLQGLTEVTVHSAYDVLELLAKGSQGRATGATNMNAQSSRSHAIFTINITMQNRENLNERKTARFNLVDLAGSERSKKTGAVGTTFKEGVNINKGLLVLGNVISALGDEKQQHNYIPYRDSNLTRLLKDSLGGNSITLMIACASPADYNLDETVSTLRYADRARKIKNKPIVNQDAKTAEIIELRRTIQQLRLQIIGQGGPAICSAEVDQLQKKISELNLKIRNLTFQLSNVLGDNTELLERMLILQTANENLTMKLNEVKEEYDITLNNITAGIENNDPEKLRENLEKLQQIQSKFIDIQAEQKKTDTEIQNHETTFTVQLHNKSNGREMSAEAEINDRQATYTKHQMELKNELEEVTKVLALKEHLARQIQSNNNYMIDYTALAENEDKVNLLTKEKEELLLQLKNVQSKESSNKLAEQRRKRVQELESQIQDLRKKIQEQARLIKLKEKDDIKIRHLNSEIVHMKQDKVRLIRNMREGSERFRLWRQQRERELSRLKQEDRKKQNKIVKMEAMHTKQQNVLKRKVEEVAAVNKRLKEALALRQQAQEQRLGGKIERVGHWLKQEIDVYINIIEAESTLSDLLEDRAMLQQQLNDMKEDSEADSQQMKHLQEDIEIRSLQIQDIQQKVLDFNEDKKGKTRWDNVQGMAEAKIALKTLWDMLAEIKKSEVTSCNKINEMQTLQDEKLDRIKELEKENKLLKQKHNQELDMLQKEQGEKISILLNELRGKDIETYDEILKQRCTIQQEKLEQLEKEKLELQEKLDFISDALEKTETKLKQKESIQEQGTSVNVPENHIEQTPPTNIKQIRITKVKKNKTSDDGHFKLPENKENEELNFSTDYEEDDDPERDPDWRKTPLGKRIIEEKKLLQKQSLFFNESYGIKRTSEGGCMCTRNCTNRCGCKKSSKSCTSSCKCPNACTNKESSIVSSSTEDGDNSQADSESKKQKLLAPPVHKSERKRNLFTPNFDS